MKTLPQVVLTPHSAFLTHEALGNIADTTVGGRRAGGGRRPACAVTACMPPAPPQLAARSPLPTKPNLTKQVGNLRECALGLPLTNQVRSRRASLPGSPAC